jgi:hypothetical protein
MTMVSLFAERDRHRWRGARHLRAAILVRSSNHTEASVLLHDLLGGESNLLTRASLTRDLAECLCRMGRAAEALPLATEALAVFVRTGNAEAVARAMWVRGHALSGAGQHDCGHRYAQRSVTPIRRQCPKR